MIILDQIIMHYKVLLLALVVIFIAFFVYYRYRKNRFSIKTHKQLKRISYDIISNVVLDNGLDQYAQFDYLLLTEQGIIVLDVKNYEGHIFGADKIDEWTQIINRKSYKFDNPFFELSHKIELLKEINKSINISGLLLFTDDADFPKGCPTNVTNLKQLKDIYPKIVKQEIPVAMQGPWKEIKNKIISNN